MKWFCPIPVFNLKITKPLISSGFQVVCFTITNLEYGRFKGTWSLEHYSETAGIIQFAKLTGFKFPYSSSYVIY